MFKWITNKVIDNYIKDKIKEIKAIDIKNKIKDFINKNKEEIYREIKQVIERAVKELIDTLVNKIKDKT